MEAFSQILQGLVDHPTACMLVLTLLALGYLYRAREADAVAHRATLEKVIPVAEKLTDAVGVLERLMTKGEH
jgi:hypothetical protein